MKREEYLGAGPSQKLSVSRCHRGGLDAFLSSFASCWEKKQTGLRQTRGKFERGVA